MIDSAFSPDACTGQMRMTLGETRWEADVSNKITQLRLRKIHARYACPSSRIQFCSQGQPDFSVLANRMPPIGIMQLCVMAGKIRASGAIARPVSAPMRRRQPQKMRNRAGHRSGNGRFFGNHVPASWMPSKSPPSFAAPAGYPDCSSAMSMSPRSARLILEKFPEIDYLVIGEGEGRCSNWLTASRWPRSAT